MAVFKNTFLFCLLLVCCNAEESKPPNDQKLSKNHGGGPSSVDSRFFDLGGIINHFLPGFNLGNQGGPGRNPVGMDFPANSQFYPNVPIQGQPSSYLPGQGNNMWPVIDDASQYPNNGNTGAQRPPFNQGNFPQGNYGGVPPQYPPYPNPDMGGPYSGSPQYPESGNYGGAPISPYPNQGGFGSGSMPQNPGQGTFMNPGNPNGGISNTPPQFPPYPSGINNGNPMQNQYPNQSPWNKNPNNFGPGGGDGTLDSLVPPQNPSNTYNPETPNDFIPENTAPGVQDPNEMPNESENGNAILGRPVFVPPSTTEAGQIIYPSSTQSPSQRQCVQDCETTTEYNPVCGSDNITYINPGKFVCARNCGINVFVACRGRCPEDTPYPRNVLNPSRPSFIG